MPHFLSAMTKLKESFWEPYLPYAVNAMQKSIEDTKNVSYPTDRIQEIFGILDAAIAEKGVDAAQSDLFQGLKLLSFHGALPFDAENNGAPCIHREISRKSKYPPQIAGMVGALCAAQAHESVSKATQKKWAEKTYKSRYAGLPIDTMDAESKPESSQKKCILLQGPRHWFCQENG